MSLVVFNSDKRECLSNISATPLLINTTLLTSGGKTTPKYSSFLYIAFKLTLLLSQPPLLFSNYVLKYDIFFPYSSFVSTNLFLYVVNSIPEFIVDILPSS